MNAKELQKKLVIEVGALAAILVVCGAIVYSLSLVIEDYERESREIEMLVTKVSAEKSALRAKFDSTQENLDLYEEALKANPKAGVYGNRQESQEIFDKLQKIYGVNISRVILSPPHDMKGAQYTRPTASVVASDLKLVFDISLDEYFYAMLDAIQNDLLGSTKITYVKLSRTEPFSDKAVAEIENTGVYPLLKGEMTMNWFSIRTIEKTEDDAAKPEK
jgi:hypothetical protein